MKTLIIGLGNPLLGDDGVGWRVAEQVAQSLSIPVGASTQLEGDPRPLNSIEVDCLALGGLSLMERMVGYERAIVIDAIGTGQPVGHVSTFRLEELPNLAEGHTTSAHDTSLQTAISLGRSLGAHLPQEVFIIGIEANQVYDFTEELSPAVTAAAPIAVQAVLELLSKKTLA